MTTSNEKSENQQPVTLSVVEGQQPTPPTITDHIIAALCEFYQPAGEPESMELKTTIDLIDEIASIADIEKWTVTLALETAGFKLKYTDAGMYWKLYRK